MKPMRQTSAEEQRPPTPLLDSAAARLVKKVTGESAKKSGRPRYLIIGNFTSHTGRPHFYQQCELKTNFALIGKMSLEILTYVGQKLSY